MKDIIYWDFNKNEVRESAIHSRSSSAANYYKKLLDNDNIFNNWIYSFKYYAIKQCEKIIGQKIHGNVLEAGAGTGIYSCIIAQNAQVQKIYALEYSETCIKELTSFVIKKFNLSKNEEEKIQPIVGSFDNIRLPDNSVDFVIAMGSLHHSENREKTINELYRVLKIGGYLIACERASYNTLTNKNLSDSLDREFSLEKKKRYGLDDTKNFTRRMNSEHEPLLAEWEYLCTKAGFKTNIFWFLYIRSKKSITKGIQKILWIITGGFFFNIFGNKLMKKRKTQILHCKIPYYPFFSKDKKNIRNINDILILAEKKPYISMP